MAFVLGSRACAAGYRLAQYESIGSTSAEALARAAAGDAGRLWVVAREQTAGHGRRGRTWETTIGNLAASLLIVQQERRLNSATLGFVAGLALDSAIRSVVSTRDGSRQNPPPLRGRVPPTRRLRLKWPNDVLCDGAKLAGILLEAVSVKDKQHSLVIGIGVNVRHAPGGIPYPVTSLLDCGADVSPEALFAAVADAWVEEEQLWDEGRGFAVIRDRWLERAAGLGAPIAVKIGEDVYRGTFETIDDEGRMVVRSADGSARAISAGDVHFGRAATALN